MDFEKKTFTAKVKDKNGNTQLSVTRIFGSSVIADDIDDIPGVIPSSKSFRILFSSSLIISIVSGIVLIILIVMKLTKKKQKMKSS